MTISRAAPATAPMIPPTQPSTREMPIQSEFPPKSPNPSPAPSPAASRDSPIILPISAMTLPCSSFADGGMEPVPLELLLVEVVIQQDDVHRGVQIGAREPVHLISPEG